MAIETTAWPADTPTVEEDEAFEQLGKAQSGTAPAPMLLLTVRQTYYTSDHVGAVHSVLAGIVSRLPLSESLRQLAAYEDAYAVANHPRYVEHHLVGVASMPHLTAAEIVLARLVDLQSLAQTGDAA